MAKPKTLEELKDLKEKVKDPKVKAAIQEKLATINKPIYK